MPPRMVCIKCRYKWVLKSDRVPYACPYCSALGTVIKAEELEKQIFDDLEIIK